MSIGAINAVIANPFAKHSMSDATIGTSRAKTLPPDCEGFWPFFPCERDVAGQAKDQAAR
jgi:hypothetical protein